MPTLNINDDRLLHEPDEGLVRKEVGALPREHFIVLARGEDDYVQAYRGENDAVQLEHRAGSYERHFAATSDSLTLADVQEAFAGFLSGAEDWTRAWAWERIEFDEDFEGDLTADNAYVIEGQEYPKVPVGQESTSVDDGGGQCRVCGAASGGYHVQACELEQCPRCGGILVDCPCE